ncbi:EamA family transporter [Chitinophaga lutea]
MKKGTLQGILLVAAGAASYGILATLVRLAYDRGYTTTEVTVAQYTVGLLALALLQRRKENGIASRPDVWKLVLGGTSYGLTGFCYYMSVRYLPVSICVILLMQTIWMGVVLEALLEWKFPRLQKLLAMLAVLAGTVLATDALSGEGQLNLPGLLWGLAAAVTYTISLYVANRVATGVPSRRKSFLILCGGTFVVLLIGLPDLARSFDPSILWTWGLALGLFGTVLPPLLLNVGMPKTGIGLGSIIIAIEIPISVTMAFVLLHEKVNALQWLGIVLIIGSIVLMNYRLLKRQA